MALAWFSPKVEKRDSPIEGTGLFALEPIPAGELVVIKGGHVFSRKRRDQLEKTLGPAEIQIEDDLFIGPVEMSERYDAMMHLNHSCDPNVGIQGQICFHAMREIEAGEELSFDYATGDDDDWEMNCSCGSTQCRGLITGKDWKLPELQRRYRGWFSLYLARKIWPEDFGLRVSRM